MAYCDYCTEDIILPVYIIEYGVMLTAKRVKEQKVKSDSELPVWDITDVQSWMTIKAIFALTFQLYSVEVT